MVKNKNKNKKKRDDTASMDVSETKIVSEAAPEAMDTTETGDVKLAARARKVTSMRKGIPMKRTKNARKKKAVAKAIALNEKYEEKASKNDTKTLRTLSAKKLYD